MAQEISYSAKYNDDEYEYRYVLLLFYLDLHIKWFINVILLDCSHVILPKHIATKAAKGRLMTETEWRGIGVTQSRGWAHYMIHKPGLVDA